MYNVHKVYYYFITFKKLKISLIRPWCYWIIRPKVDNCTFSLHRLQQAYCLPAAICALLPQPVTRPDSHVKRDSGTGKGKNEERPSNCCHKHQSLRHPHRRHASVSTGNAGKCQHWHPSEIMLNTKGYLRDILIQKTWLNAVCRSNISQETRKTRLLKCALFSKAAHAQLTVKWLTAAFFPYVSHHCVRLFCSCFHTVSRLEAELLLEREAKRGNLLLRPGSSGDSFAVTTRQEHNGYTHTHAYTHTYTQKVWLSLFWYENW